MIPTIYQWADAIAQWEGADGLLNNPGDLKVSSLTKSWGAQNGFQASDGGWIAKFTDYETGFNALCKFLILGVQNHLIAFHSSEARTLGGFMKIYAGNPPETYIQGICILLGVTEQFDISTFII